MQASVSLSHHSASRSNPSRFTLDRFCLDCQAFVELNQHGRCGVCDSNAVSLSPLPTKSEITLRQRVSVSVVRETEAA